MQSLLSFQKSQIFIISGRSANCSFGELVEAKSQPNSRYGQFDEIE